MHWQILNMSDNRCLFHCRHAADQRHELNRDGGRGRGRGGDHDRGRGRGRGGRGRGDHRSILGETVPPMGFVRMRNLLTRADKEILLELADTCKGFKQELDATQPNDRARFGLPLLLMGKAFSTNGFPQVLTQLMILVRDTNWFIRLPIFLQGIRDFNHQDTEYLENVLLILKVFLTKMPSTLDLVNQVLLTLEYLCKVRDILPSFKHDLENQIAELQRSTDEMEKKKEEQKKADNYIVEDFLKPPEDFLEISVLPSEDDLVRDEKPFIRMNKCQGRYQDLAHYLDVQFRLLRADFVGPLQNGIQTYLQTKDQQVPRRGPAQDIRIYENVRVIGPVCHRNGVAYKIQFDTTKLGNVRWETTKRFLFGSLVCLSADNFVSVFFGIVANRDAKDLSNGELDIFIEGECEAFLQLDYSEALVMVESMAFFEAYRPVLLGLKAVKDAGLAMYSYIVECDMEPKPPNYLRGNSTCFDMRCLIPNGEQSRQWSNVPVLQRDMWPNADDLGLDSSQYNALNTALTQEFALIQGPPGTGKTFLGLKIAEVLLENCQDVLAIHQKPMMVVCYTNHALDQFLEGIHKFAPGGILRIGGRCKSEILENCKLHIVRKKCMELKLVGNDFRHAAGALHAEMKETEDEIEECTAIVEQLNKRILYTGHLSEVISDRHEEQFMRMPVPSKYAIMEWLGHGLTMPFRQPAENEQVQDNVDEFINAEEEVEVINMMRQLDIEDANYDQKTAANRKARVKLRALNHLGVESEDVDDTFNAAGGWQITANEKKQRKKDLRRRLTNVNAMTEEEARAVNDITRLPIDERWRLYHFWLKQFRRRLRERTQRMATEYHNAAQRLQEIHRHTDLEVMRRMKVVGMTTTGAARYQNIIQQLAPPIVIIEEAAEVLEAHVVTALNPDCKHLILIGDHKQLRPSPTVYELAYKYHLDLSLFERMINNGLDCVTLSTQHRMRPEISLLIKPIYPELKNHESVLNYPAIRGVKHNLFLIDHQQNEDHNEELVSKMNRHEAKYISRLCSYLLQQGYEPEQITVLTPYSGQMFLIRKEMPRNKFSGVRICVLDNYQGEENDIILLSLVRSNREGKLGFLGVENRICVALSRAKMGFYIIGDFTMFGANDIWVKILKLVGEHRGPGLPLYCPNHPDNEGIDAVTFKDFNQVPEGGCTLPCEYRMPCGHTCPLVCHGYDPEHRNIKCTKPCAKILCTSRHKCPKLCHQECGECRVKVEKRVPECRNIPKHQIRVACSEDLFGVSCSAQCEHLLSCGHQCVEKCGSPHTTHCRVKVEKVLPCGHTANVECDKDVAAMTCRNACGHVMSCGHPCGGDCTRCLWGRMHIGCRQLCRRPLVCNHSCGNYCCGVCPPCQLPCETRCVHSKCPKPCGEPCTPCIEPCAWVCEHYQCTRPCYSPCNRPPCNRRCRKLLPCRHRCVGVCGETCPPLCRNCNREELCEIFFGTEDEDDALFVYLEDCQHTLEVTGLDQWVNINNESEEAAIQPKVCPRCKTAIRKNLRYGKAVNASSNDIQVVKQKAFEERTRFHGNRREILLEILSINEDILSLQWQHLIDDLKEENKPLPNQSWADMHTLLNTLKAIRKTKMDVMVKLAGNTHQSAIICQLKSLTIWLNDCPGRFHSEVASQLDTEWKRLELFIKVR